MTKTADTVKTLRRAATMLRNTKRDDELIVAAHLEVMATNMEKAEQIANELCAVLSGNNPKSTTEDAR